MKLKAGVLVGVLVSQGVWAGTSGYYGTLGAGYSNSDVFGKILADDGEHYVYNSFLSSLSAGYRFNGDVALELNGIFSFPFQEDRLPDMSQYRVNALYYLTGGSLRPYAMAGAGYGEFRSPSPADLDSSGFVYGGGLGLEYSVNMDWFARGEVRVDQLHDGSYEYLNIMLSAGYNFGNASGYQCAGSKTGDFDRDGVPDVSDICPDTPRGVRVNSVGCAVFEGKLDGVSFDSGSADLTRGSRKILDKVSVELKKYPEIRIFVQAYTDSVGSEKANLNLSRERANSVKKYLVNRGVKASRIIPEGYGEAHPVATNKTREGRALNRRVVFKVVQ